MTGKKKIAVIVAAVVCGLLFLTLAIVGVFYVKVNQRLQSFQNGMTFTADYKAVIPEGMLYTGKSGDYQEVAETQQGSLVGEMNGEVVHLEVTPKDAVFTVEAYRDGSQMVINLKRLYDVFVEEISASQPLVSALLPEWSAGEYISLEQLEEITGMQLELEIPSASGKINVLAFQKVDYENGDEEKTYFQIRGMEETDYELYFGIEPSSLFEDPLRLHLILKQKSTGIELELDMELVPEENIPIAVPTDVLSEEDVTNLKSLWEALLQLKELAEQYS